MKCLTLRQPMAGAVAHGKDVENRSVMFQYRGLLAIHAGLGIGDGDAFADVDRLTGGRLPLLGAPGRNPEWTFGAVIGVVDLVSAHRAGECEGRCSPWARPMNAHHRLANWRPLTRPVSTPGRQGLWTPDPDLATAIRKQLP